MQGIKPFGLSSVISHHGKDRFGNKDALFHHEMWIKILYSYIILSMISDKIKRFIPNAYTKRKDPHLSTDRHNRMSELMDDVSREHERQGALTERAQRTVR